MKALRYVLLTTVCLLTASALGQDLVENVTNELGSAEWIWSPAHTQERNSGRRMLLPQDV